MTVVELTHDCESGCRETVLGQNLLEGELQQYIVKGDTWFGCFPAPDTAFSFVGCTVAPGFEFTDLVLGSREKLLKEFPNASEMIIRLTEGLP